MRKEELVTISVQLEKYIIDEIKNSIKALDHRDSSSTKVAPWIRRVIYRTLNIPLPLTQYKKDPYLDLRHVEINKLSAKLKLLVELWNKGYSLAEMVKWLDSHKVPTLRAGALWSKKSILGILRNVAKRHAKRQEKELLGKK
jgi:hypothetical protein